MWPPHKFDSNVFDINVEIWHSATGCRVGLWLASFNSYALFTDCIVKFNNYELLKYDLVIAYKNKKFIIIKFNT